MSLFAPPTPTHIGPYAVSGNKEHSDLLRWRCNLRPDAAVLRHTKSEAIAWYKELLGVTKLPTEAIVEAF